MENFRPVVTGIIGAIISFCLAYLMCKFFPDLYSENSLSKLRRKYGKKVRIANVLSGIGFVMGVSAYFLKLIPRNDWRGIGLAFGLMAILPFLYLLVLQMAKVSKKESMRNGPKLSGLVGIRRWFSKKGSSRQK